jgi:hypothetical protein
MSATSIKPDPVGRVRIIGKVHGAMNTIVQYADDPEDWMFKQFVSQDQLEAFATEENLTIEENAE